MASAPQEFLRLGFHEMLAMAPLGASRDAHGRVVRRFISRQPAWKPGEDLPWEIVHGPHPKHSGPGAFGGHVYAQASLCAARAVEADEAQRSAANGTAAGVLGIHASVPSRALATPPCL